MPLFKSPSSDNSTSTPRQGGLLSSNRHSPSPPSSRRTSSTHQGFFRRRDGSRSPEDSSLADAQGSGGVIANDPTIIAARQKVKDAENAEKEADRALLAARSMVKEAREHVKALAREALEE